MSYSDNTADVISSSSDKTMVSRFFADDLQQRYDNAGISLDVVEVQERLEIEKSRLLLSDDQVSNINAVLLRSPGDTERFIVTDEASFKRIPVSRLAEERKDQMSSFLFLEIPCIIAWGPLQVNYVLLRRIVRSLNRSPYLFDLLQLYGRKVRSMNEAYPVFKHDLVSGELNYNLAYVDLTMYGARRDCANKRDDAEGIWRLRKMGISVLDRTFILIRPSERFKKKLENSWKVSTTEYDTYAVHIMAIEAANSNWLYYLNYLEGRFLKINDRTQCWRTTSKNLVDFDDISLVQSYKDELLVLLQAIRINLQNLESLGNVLRSHFTLAQRVRLEHATRELYQDEERTRLLIKRSTCIMNTLPVLLAREENLQLLTLTKRSTENARSVKVVTFVTMVFLPPSLMASIMGMEIFSVSKDSGRLKVSSTKDLGYFLAATLLFVFATLGAWSLWESVLRKHVKSGDEEE